MTLDAFPDARTVLQDLKRGGHITAILSNGSPPMLTAAVDAAKIGGDLDAVLSVDAIGIYKPRPEVYALVTERFGLAPRDVVVRFLEPLGRGRRARVRFPTQPGSIAPGLPDEYPDMAADVVARDLTGIIGRFESECQAAVPREEPLAAR